MKRRDFIRELERAGCRLDRHGKRHDVYLNPANGNKAPVPRHREIAETMCRLIRRQLVLEGE
jgi:mRNA interferase HicA